MDSFFPIPGTTTTSQLQAKWEPSRSEEESDTRKHREEGTVINRQHAKSLSLCVCKFSALFTHPQNTDNICLLCSLGLL